MNFVRNLGSSLGLTKPDNSKAEVGKVLPLADEPAQCDPSQCVNSYSKSCFKLNAKDVGTPLWETAKPFDFQILVSTGKHDWKHDAFDESKTVINTISKFKYDKYGKVKLNVTSLPIPLLDPAYKKQQKADLLIMPYFVWVKGITSKNCDAALSIVLQKLIVEHAKFADLPKEIEGAQLSADGNRSYVFICSHNTRDKRCGRTAPVMKKEFDSQLRDLGYYRDAGDSRAGGVCVAFVNHVGGHKFASNVLIYNKGGEFAWFARCTPLNVRPIIDETILQGKVFPEITRTVKRNSPVSW